MARALVVVAPSNTPLEHNELEKLATVDQGFAYRVVTTSSEKHQRLVLAPSGSLTGDTDDVRKVGGAAASGAKAAFAMGATHLTLSLDKTIQNTKHPVDGMIFKHSALVAELAVHQAAYVPLQAREHTKPKLSPLAQITVEGPPDLLPVPGTASAIEAGRKLARDIASGDPERMAPPRLAECVLEECKLAGIDVEILSDPAYLQAEYPLLMAVARCSMPVVRHRPRVVRLSWSGTGPIQRTICIAGKGVTYDTGGADLKVGGSMAGLRLDKCGAGAAAGFILACAKTPEAQTRGLRVLVELGCVRNSIGSEAYVADEIITSHSGKRVLIGNTDAEGRLVLADCLSHLRTHVINNREGCPNPTFISIATLTGHAARASGPYAVANDNGAARAAGGVARHIAYAGTLLGQPLDVSSLRREDYLFIAPGSIATPVARSGFSYDVVQANTQSSINTARGHQYPMAFLDIASGLQDHAADCTLPLPFCHIDLAGSVMDERGVENGSPIVPLYGHFVLRLSNIAARL